MNPESFLDSPETVFVPYWMVGEEVVVLASVVVGWVGSSRSAREMKMLAVYAEAPSSQKYPFGPAAEIAASPGIDWLRLTFDSALDLAREQDFFGIAVLDREDAPSCFWCR